MDIDLTPGQQLLRESARTQLERTWTTARTRETQDGPDGYDRVAWRELADIGLVGVAIPEAYGGSGGSFVDEVIVAQELGRAAFPSPFLTTVVESASLVAAHGSDAQRSALLTPIASGESIVSFAFLEPDLDWRPGAVAARATRAGNGLRLSGRKVFAPYAAAAAHVLVPVRLDDGLAVAVVPRDTAGLEVSELPSVSGHVFDEVRLNGVEIPVDALLGGGSLPEAAIADALRRAAVAQCAMAVGIARRLVHMSAEYAKLRVQFGNPIGSYQGVQHRLAEMLSFADAVELLAHQAAWRIAEGLPAGREAAITKAYTNESLWTLILHAHDVLGGVGWMRDHELEVYVRVGMVAMLGYGNTWHHREATAVAMGL